VSAPSRPSWIVPAAVGLAFFALYLGTFISGHRFDAVAYLIAARSPDPRSWFHPHHLLYAWLGHVVGGVVGFDRLVGVLQGVSAFAAAVGLALYAAVLQRLAAGGSRVWPVLGVALLGLSASFWVSAVESDPYALTLACLAAASACFVRAADSGALRWHVVAGVVVSFAVLVHQMAVLFAAAYVAATLVVGPRRVRGSLALVAPAGLVTGAVYLAVGLAHGFFENLPGLLRWLTSYAHGAPWNPPGRSKLIEGLYGFLYSIAGGAAGFVPSSIVRTVAVLILAGGLWALVRHLRGTVTAGTVLAIAWLVVYVPFVLWFAPFTAAHWQFVTMPLLLLAVPVAARIGAPGPPWRRGAVAGAVAALCVVIGALNYTHLIAPLGAADTADALARPALARIPPDARVVAPIGVTTLLVVERLGAGAVFVVPHRPRDGEPPGAVVERLRAFIEQSGRERRPLWIFGSLLEARAGGYLGDAALTLAVSDLLRDVARDGRVGVLETTSLAAAPRPL
jgi:hypothetical protein